MDSRALVLVSVAGIAGVGLLRARSSRAGGSRAVAPALPVVPVLHAQDTRPCWDDDPVPGMDDLAWVGRKDPVDAGSPRGFVTIDLVQISQPVYWARISAWQPGHDGRPCAHLLARMRKREDAVRGTRVWRVTNSILDPRLRNRGLGRDGYLAVLVFLLASAGETRILFTNDACGGSGSSVAALRVWNGLCLDFPCEREDQEYHERIAIVASVDHPLLQSRVEAFRKTSGRSSVTGIAGLGLVRARPGGSRAVASALPIVSVLHDQDTRPCWDDDPVPDMDDLAWVGNISRNRHVTFDLVEIGRAVHWARVDAQEIAEVAETPRRCADLLEQLRESVDPAVRDAARGADTWSVMNSYLDPRLENRGLGRDGYLGLLAFLMARGGHEKVLFSNDGCNGGSSSRAALRVWNGLCRDFPHARNDRMHHERVVILASAEHHLLRPRVEAYRRNKGRLPRSPGGTANRGSRQDLPVAFPTAAEAQVAALAARNTVTATPAFREWFGGSCVVDAQGRPQVCYHGRSLYSPASQVVDFTTFSDQDAPDRGGLLAFFATEPSFADGYARGVTGPHSRPRVYPVYLAIQDVFDFRKHGHLAKTFYEETGGIQDDYEARRILMGQREDDGTISDIANAVEDIADRRFSSRNLTKAMFARSVRQGSWDALEAGEFVEWLRQGGHDGIVLLEGGSVNYGIFEPTQVKSATGNTGAFDPEEASISANRGSAARGTACGGTPDLRRLDRRLYRALRDEKGEALGILDRDRALGGGADWGQGGCAVLAKALLDVFPKAAPYAIVEKGHVQHFVVRLGDRYLDGDGAVTRETLLRRWEKEWSAIWTREGRDVRACRLVPVRRVAVGDVSAAVPARFSGRCQASVVKALADYLRPRLLGEESR